MKHLFSENDPQQDPGWSGDTPDSSTSASPFGEELNSLERFSREIFHPAWQSLTQAASALLVEWFSGGLNMIGQIAHWHNQQQRHKKISLHTKQPAPLAKTLTLESKLALRKITTELGSGWNSALVRGVNAENQKIETDEINRPPLKKTNPWLEASKKQSCTLSFTMPKTIKPAKSDNQRKKTSVDEPNGGLDDIFTRPVRGFFGEDDELVSRKKLLPQLMPQWKKASDATTQKKRPAASFDAKPEPRAPKLKPLTPKFSALQAMPAMPQSRPGKSIGSLGETFEALQAAVYNSQPAAPAADSLEAEFIPGLSRTGIEPPQDFNPDALSKMVSDEAPVASITPKSGEPKHFETKPNAGPSRMLAKARAAHFNFKRQMPIYHEMKVEMSAADYMVGNNRILHNSISNLANSYFKKAAEEETQASQANGSSTTLQAGRIL